MTYKYRSPFDIIDDNGNLYMETRTYKNRKREIMKKKTNKMLLWNKMWEINENRKISNIILNYKEKLEKYLKLNYKMKVYPIKTNNDKVEWGVEYPDLPGCVGGGDTKKEAIKMAENAKITWLEIALKKGKKIPLPKELNNN
jgi:predicted RNase H-like HicB family nuclease